MLFFKSPENVQRKYFEYWKSDVWGNFGGVPKSALIDNYLKAFVSEGIIILDEEKEKELDNTIMKKGYQNINICPSLYMEYYLGREDVVSLDKVGELIPHIRSKMIEVLSVLNHSLNLIIK